MTFSTRPLRAVAEVALGRQRSPDRAKGPHMVPYLRAANVKDGLLDLSDIKEMDFTPDEQDNYSLQPGDVLVSEGAGSLQAVGANAVWSGETDGTVCFQNTLLRLRARDEIDSRYLGWWARHAYYSGLLASVAGGVNILHLGAVRVRNLPCPVPPLDEQRRIVEYLDTEAARIDDLVSEQEGLIKLLEERRSAAVSTLLTRGLRSGVASKHSGIDLLGEIPEHWRMVPTRFVATITTGSEDSGNATEDGEYPFYVRGREILRIGRFSFDCEAVMTPGDGQGGTGKVFHYFDGKFEAHQRVYVFKDFKNIAGRFFYYYLSSFLGPIALAGSNTVTMESLRRPLLASFPVALPPIEEQVDIVAEADRQVAVIEKLIAEAQAFCDLAKERRAALITAAVTGGLEAVGRVA